MIHVVEQDREFLVQFDYNPRLVQVVKSSFSKRRWDAVRKCWVVPLHLRSEMEAFKQRHNVQEPTREQMAELIGEIPPLPELSVPTAGKLMIEPFHYQKRGIARGLELKRFINGDQPGLGKTLQSLATVTLANAFPCLVICPPLFVAGPCSLLPRWRQSLGKAAATHA